VIIVKVVVTIVVITIVVHEELLRGTACINGLLLRHILKVYDNVIIGLERYYRCCCQAFRSITLYCESTLQSTGEICLWIPHGGGGNALHSARANLPPTFKEGRMEKNVTDGRRNRQETYDDLDGVPLRHEWASFGAAVCVCQPRNKTSDESVQNQNITQTKEA
jgi:hypothetical protein